MKGYFHRVQKTVRTRCLEFIGTLRLKEYKELPVEEAKDLFSEIIDQWNPKTLELYFGVQPHKATTRINRRKQYTTGTVSNANIELTREVGGKKGYLEKLGLVKYEKRGLNWFMVLENAILVPEIMKSVETNINKIYLPTMEPSLTIIEEEREKPNGVSLVVEEEKRERDHRGRYINCEIALTNATFDTTALARGTAEILKRDSNRS